MISYWALRAWMPIAAVCLYAVLWDHGGASRVICRVARVCVAAGAVLLVAGMWSGFTLSLVAGSKLSYESAIEACLFAFLTLSLIEGEHGILGAALGVSAVGILYEWPLSLESSMVFNPVTLSAPLGLNTQILSCVVLALVWRRRVWRPVFVAAVLVYAVSCLYLLSTAPLYYPTIWSVHRWVVRLPSYALVAALLWDVKVILSVKDKVLRGLKR